MTRWLWYALSGVAILTVAIHGLLTARQWIRRIIAANLLASGLFLLLVALARRAPSGSPDPVPQALVLTGIVVSVSASAVALVVVGRLARGARRTSGSDAAPRGPAAS